VLPDGILVVLVEATGEEVFLARTEAVLGPEEEEEEGERGDTEEWEEWEARPQEGEDIQRMPPQPSGPGKRIL